MKILRIIDLPRRANGLQSKLFQEMVNVAQTLNAGQAVKFEQFLTKTKKGFRTGGNQTYYNNKLAAQGIPARIMVRDGIAYLISTLPETDKQPESRKVGVKNEPSC